MRLTDLQLRLLAFVVGTSCTTVALADVYARNTQLGHEILPFGLSGVFPSFASAFAGTLLALAVVGPTMLNQYLLICLLVLLGGSTYEVSQVWSPYKTFDCWDIVALILGVVFSVGFARLFAPDAALQEWGEGKRWPRSSVSTE